MHPEVFRPLLESGDIQNELFENTIGVRKATYFDFTATGLAYRPIEKRMEELLEYYARIFS